MKAIHMYIKSRALERLFPNGPIIMWLSAKSQALRERYRSALKLIFFILVSNEQKVLESGVAAPESSQHTHLCMYARTNMPFLNRMASWKCCLVQWFPSSVFCTSQKLLYDVMYVVVSFKNTSQKI